MMEQKDERVRRTGELLTYIRTLKMYGWELLFTSWLMKTRSLEVKYLSTRKYLDAWCVFFWATTPTLFSFFTFGLYVMMGNQLDAATVFTCLALFNNLISPLNSFPWVINGLIYAVISTRRLSKFLSCSEHESHHWKANNSSSSFSKVEHWSISEGADSRSCQSFHSKGFCGCCYWRGWFRGHWVLRVLDMNTLTCYYLDSLRPCQVHQGFRQIVDTAMMLYATQSNLSKIPILKRINRVCPCQPGGNECGYCVLKYIMVGLKC